MFKNLLFLSAIFTAGCAAFFSVKGIGLLFSGSFWAAVTMASSLELAKIVATSFLYRNWREINKLLKTYLLIAVISLMGITSLGVFGFLSQAFFSTKSNIDAIEMQISLLKDKKQSLEFQLSQNQERIKILIDTRKNQEANLSKVLDQSTTTTVTKSGGLFGQDKQDTVVDKRSLELKNQSLSNMQNNISSIDSSINDINKNNNKINEDISILNNEIINLNKNIIGSDIGTYKFIAQAFNTNIETVVKWFIILIVIVFDPLAIALLISYNMIIKQNPKDITEKPLEIIKKIYQDYKRGTKKNHNNKLADPKFNA